MNLYNINSILNLKNKIFISTNIINTLNLNEGKIFIIDNKEIGLYKSLDSKIYAINPICPYLGSKLYWNNLSKTWNCPYCGGKFDYDGKSIYGLNKNNLEIIDIDIFAEF